VTVPPNKAINLTAEQQRFACCCQCKDWNSAIPKEKVLALKSVVEDVGVDRSVLISTAGFQRGLELASKKSVDEFSGTMTLRLFPGLKEP
jgi:hypothetical protein